jgi:cleavage and polyadenylation specificity factor subunit 1
MYEPFHYPVDSQSQSFTANLRWKKVSQPHLAKYSEESDLESATSGRESLLQRIDNIDGYSTVFQAGTSPCFLLKEASSTPSVVPLRGKAVRGLSGFHTPKYDRGFAYADAEVSPMKRTPAPHADLVRELFACVNCRRTVNMAAPDGSRKRLI